MNLTKRERTILQFAQQGLSDYKIARKINSDPPSITRSRKNAYKKLVKSVVDIEWLVKIGFNISELSQSASRTNQYIFFL
ncbi:MAG: LuxR C-terminal-related transcriptional regulator [Candidatus Bathyarchaeia archaeon]